MAPVGTQEASVMGAGDESDGRRWPSRSRERLGWCWGGRDRDNAARGSAVWKEEGLVCGRVYTEEGARLLVWS